MSSDTDSSCQKGALLGSLLTILGIHLLSLPLFARFLNSRRNTRRKINVDLVTNDHNIWMTTIGKEGTKSYATYTPDFDGAKVVCSENNSVEIVENYPNPPDGNRHHLGTIDADQRDMDRLRDAILQSSLVICPLPGDAVVHVWNILYRQGYLDEEKFRAGEATLTDCVGEMLVRSGCTELPFKASRE
ncbi:hypothetical protein X797_007623 [Metarhizium robertsii]|uniref:Uncharacterized protein n=2 Tax=Metarhizium robertsii TaxID=568076 RepID=E9F8D1_METRA|nr:uncharacterized protein MAA_08530 [Metarhizium robertsii ARSEF 23]EFY96038.1 hypothetical protein MAA_08530 [Metarhizium robertsii ARSEF 23]EXU99195.1 hypothetical protein X797_007623 [Metarhizium robertsii]